MAIIRCFLIGRLCNLSIPKKGLSRNSFALLAGICAALALPPWHFLILLVLSFSGLYRLVKGATSAKRAFFDGWLFGFGFFGCGLYWIGAAFFVEPEVYGWMAPIAIFIIAAGMGLFTATHLWAFRGLEVRVGSRWSGGVVTFSIMWASFEWVRSWILTGFPWNLIGTVWMSFESILQTASVVGVLGLGALTVFLATSPALLLETQNKLGICMVIFAAFLGSSLWGLGVWRLSNFTPEFAENVILRLVQPNVPQHLKWKESLRLSHLQQLKNMSQNLTLNTNIPTHIIWPETAVPFFLSNSPKLKKFIGSIVPPGGLIITGAPRTDGISNKTWNSILAINSQGKVVSTYDKSHLVPFGEYVPFRKILPLNQLVEGRSDFSIGSGPKTLMLPGLPPVAPLICFEAIFFDVMTDDPRRPAWILNLTNDAWFGDTAGPRQHLAATQFRAIEEGVPLIRVANTGITAVVNPLGKIIASAPINTGRIIDTMLPKPTMSETIFSRWKNYFTAIFVSILFIISTILILVKEKK